jgi:hypothetical protein
MPTAQENLLDKLLNEVQCLPKDFTVEFLDHDSRSTDSIPNPAFEARKPRKTLKWPKPPTKRILW